MPTIPLKILIVEDDITTQERLSTILSGLGYEIIGLFDAVEDALAVIRQSRPDLLLLDVHLGENKPTGIDLAREVRQFSDVPIIFLSVYKHPSYARNAFDLGAHRYMTKPIREFELQVEVDFAIRDYLEKIHYMSPRSEPHRDIFVLTAAQTYQKILIQDIAYVEAQGSSVHIHTLEGKKFTQSCSLKSFEDQTSLSDPKLIRIHRSYLVNSEKIESLSRSYELTLSNGTRLTVGKSFHSTVKQLLNIIWSD